MRQLHRHAGAFAATALLASIGLGVHAGPAGAEITEPAGRCHATATFVTGPHGRSLTVSTDSLTRSEVTTVAREDTVRWKGELLGTDPGSRAISGNVRIDLPWPLPDITFASWRTTTDRTAKSGVRTYSLPSATPRGVVLHVYGEHHDGGTLWCNGSMDVQLAGGSFGPLTLGSIGLLVGSALLALLASRLGGLVLGGLSGLLTLGFLGTTLVLLGIVPLASPIVTVLPVIGIPAGIAWAKAALLRA